LAHLFTHLHSPSYIEARRRFGGSDVVVAVAQFILVYSFGISLLCATPLGGALTLYGGIATALVVVFLVELAFVLGFI
jgi:putative flippase GtrA